MAPQYHPLIFSDLLEITPIDPLIMPDPYDENHSVKTNIKMFYRLLQWSSRMNDRISGLINAYYLEYLLEERLFTPSEQRKYHSLLSKHYLEACVRVYNFFRIVGVKQIYCTQRTSFWMLRKLTRTEYIQLTNDTLTLV